MLRDLYAYGSDELKEIISKFELGTEEFIDVKSFRMLTPDSFIWKLRIGQGIYYLYAEDYTPNFSHVQIQVDMYTQNQKGHFIQVKKPRVPHISNDLTQDHETDSVGIYAIKSGFDKVFLYKIDELNAEDEQDL